MKNVDSKLLLGLVVGAAVGAAVGYLAATDKREQLLEELNGVVGKVKEGFNSALAKYKEGKAEIAKTTEEIVAELSCMEKDAGEIFRELKKDLSAYVELKLELLKLNTYERTGKVIAVLSYGVILLFLAFFAILFIFLALGFFLGDLFGSVGSGFGVVAVLYLLLIGIIVMNKDRISNKVLNVVISALTTNDDKTNATDNEQSATDTTGETDF